MGTLKYAILTRSAYGPDWTREANARRLAVTEAITVPTIRAQTFRGFEWHVLVHEKDPLLRRRVKAFESAGVPVHLLFTDARGTPQEVAVACYKAAWRDSVGPGPAAMMRLDDDDGLAPDAFARLQPLASSSRQPTALVFPIGIRVWAGRYTFVRHASNAMQTLVSEVGSVYDYLHRRVRQHALVRFVDRKPAWLWYRHPDTISGWRMAMSPLDPTVQRWFPIDWAFVGPPLTTERPVRQGQAFR